MKHIRKFNEKLDNRQNGFTIGDLKKMIEGLDDETPTHNKVYM